MIPGWPYSFVAALEPGRTSWTAVLDAVRLARMMTRRRSLRPRSATSSPPAGRRRALARRRSRYADRVRHRL